MMMLRFSLLLLFLLSLLDRIIWQCSSVWTIISVGHMRICLVLNNVGSRPYSSSEGV